VLAAHIVSFSAGCETFAVSELATANPLWIATWVTNARAGIEQKKMPNVSPCQWISVVVKETEEEWLQGHCFDPAGCEVHIFI
jgi:hypothetical protein